MALIDMAQIEKVAGRLRELRGIGAPLNFYSHKVNGNEVVEKDMYPPLDGEYAIDFFFFTVLQQYGFWYDDGTKYTSPITGRIDGVYYKGSDLLFRIAMRTYKENPILLTPRCLAHIENRDFISRFFTDDVGVLPFPDLDKRFLLTREYGKWFMDNGTTPEGVLILAHLDESPLEGFLKSMRMISGYDTDALEKKNNLLAMIMTNRPEEFLARSDDDVWIPIIDYHLMRVALRLGLVRLTEKERKANEAREFVDAHVERTIRDAVFAAIVRLIDQSGHTMFAVDEVLWNARRYCPETEKPECGQCIFKRQCKQDIELFQPVFRTMAY